MAEQQSPGRVFLGAQNNTDVTRLPGFQYQTNGSSTAISDGVRGNWEPNLLNQTFFSQENFQIIQNKIRFEVYQKTGRVIDPQSADDLFMIMRAMYLQYGRNLPYNIREQIEELNTYVANWSVPKIVAEVSMFEQYQKDITSLPVPLPHPVSLSSAGSKSKPMPTFFGEQGPAF
jgi:hypothetical protein